MKNYIRLLITIAVLCLASGQGVDNTKRRKRIYNTSSTRQRGVLNVHFVPHSHCDVGWLKTPLQYFWGLNNSIAHSSVNFIIHEVIRSLAANPDRKFSWTEQFFFQEYLQNADDDMLRLTDQVVNSEQLQFVNGGYSMHDEALPLAQDMIDNTALGHRLLMEEYGIAPNVGWQLDPFGHGTFQGSVMASPISGMNAMFFMRADWQDIQHRQNTTTTEFIWAPSPSLGLERGATYAGIVYGSSYCTIENGFLSMDPYSNDSPVVDDLQAVDYYNVNEAVNATVNVALEALQVIPQGGSSDGTSDVMILLGCDFEWENAGSWYTNTDKLIHYLNLDGRVNAFYSTPSIYVNAKLEAGREYSLTAGSDLFPYDFYPHEYLTGYYTSRPALKGYIRDSSSLFASSRQMQAVSLPPESASSSENPLFLLEKTMAIVQHHDSITGSSKQHVAYSYALELARARINADSSVSASLSLLTHSVSSQWASCDLLNATICPSLEAGEPVIVLIWNQQSKASTNGASHVSNILLPVSINETIMSYQVLNERAEPVPAQILPASSSDLALRDYYNVSESNNTHWIAFQAQTIGAIGYTVFFLIPSSSVDDAKSTTFTYPLAVNNDASADWTISNGNTTLTFDGNTSLLTSFSSVPLGTIEINQTIAFYNSSQGTHLGDNALSGAYTFRPNSSTIYLPSNESVTITIIQGPIVSEARLVFSSWASEVFRLWAGQSTFECEYTIGPIPFKDHLGREVISRFNAPSIQSNDVFFTDSNGRDSNKRVINYRPTFNLSVEEPVSGNYYPVSSYIYATDETSGVTMSIATDRAQGGSSLSSGEIELMIHRRLSLDDNLGVGEVLNETGLSELGEGLIIRTRHLIDINPNSYSSSLGRRNAAGDQSQKQTIRFSSLGADSPSTWISKYNPKYSALKSDLDDRLTIMTIHALSPQLLLLRVAHRFAITDDASLAADVSLDLSTVFSSISISNCTEMTITGNIELKNAPKTTYSVKNGGGSATLPVVPQPPQGPGMTIVLKAMDIRTFKCAFLV
jgi:alpha-mannosidase